MRTEKRSKKFLFLSIISFVLLLPLIYFLPPDLKIPVLSIQFSIAIIFFLLLFLFLFSTVSYIAQSKKHGLLFALFVPIYLLFRSNGLTHPFFFFLLLALFIALELLFSYKKENI